MHFVSGVGTKEIVTEGIGEGDIATYFRFAKWLSHAVKENMTVFGELTSPEKSAKDRICSATRFGCVIAGQVSPFPLISNLDLITPTSLFLHGILSPRNQCAGI